MKSNIPAIHKVSSRNYLGGLPLFCYSIIMMQNNFFKGDCGFSTNVNNNLISPFTGKETIASAVNKNTVELFVFFFLNQSYKTERYFIKIILYQPFSIPTRAF